MHDFVVSARKYRPSIFDEVIGQESITITLKEAIKNNQLAQSFLFDKSMFITKLDLYFASKDAGIPVQVQIREMVNGFPTQTVVPFADVTLNPGSVNIDGSATTFTFPSPVFLQDGIEYAFVILANSKRDLTKTIIDLLDKELKSIKLN